MKLLVSGATGFIGSCFVKNQLDHSCRVLPRDCRIQGDGDFFSPDVFEGVDVVLHLAGLAHGVYTEQELDNVNHLGALKFAESAAKSGVRRFVFLSTVNVHGSGCQEMPLTEKSSTDSSSDIHKKHAEAGLLKVGIDTGMEISIVRSVLVYGKDAPGNMGRLIDAVQRFRVTPFGSVRSKKSFISVDNLCDFLFVCCVNPLAANEVFLISDDRAISLPDFMTSIATGLNKSMYHFPVPLFFLNLFGFMFGKKAVVRQLTQRLEVDISKAKKMLGWKPAD